MKHKKQNVGNVPNLRFPGFVGEWEKKSLGDLCDLITKGTTPQNFVESGVKFIKIESFEDNEINSNKCLFIDEVTHNKTLRRSILEENDILFAIAGATIGKVNVVEKSILPANTNQALAIIRLKKKENNQFILQVLKSPRMEKYIKESISVGAQPNLNLEQMNNFAFYKPSYEEQQKIANLFSFINSRIETQSKLIKELTISKLSISKNIFEGKIKTSNATEKWEYVQLREVLNIPKKIKANAFDRNKLLTVKLHLKGVCKNENAETLSEGATNYFIRKKGQFIYGKQNLFNGAFGIIPDEFDGYLSSADVPTLDINVSKVNPLFLLHFLGRERFYRKLEEVASGSGSKRIHETTLLNISIPLPSLSIQNKIADILDALDKKINIEKAILTQLEKQKKYLLQNLFV